MSKKRFYANMKWFEAAEQPKDFSGLPIEFCEAKALWDLDPDLNHARVVSLLQPYLRARAVLSNIKGWEKIFSQTQGGSFGEVESEDVRLAGVDFSCFPLPRCKAEATFDLFLTAKCLDGRMDKLLGDNSRLSAALVFYWEVGEEHAASELDLTNGSHQGGHLGPGQEGLLVGTGVKRLLDNLLERIEGKVLERGIFTNFVGTGFFDLSMRSEWLVGGQADIVIAFDNQAWSSEGALNFSVRGMGKVISYVQAKLEELSSELCDLEANEMLGLVAGCKVEVNSKTRLRVPLKLESTYAMARISDGKLTHGTEDEATYFISPLRKKSFIETETYSRVINDIPQNLQIETGWRWGSLTVMARSEKIMAIDVANAVGFNPEDYDFIVNSDESFDGCWSELKLPNQMSKVIRRELEILFEEGGVGALEEAGWQYVETKTVIYGPLLIKDVNGALIATPSYGLGLPAKTAWFEIATLPAHKGFYEVCQSGDVWGKRTELLRWDGRIWRNQNGKPLRLKKAALWRGLSASASVQGR